VNRFQDSLPFNDFLSKLPAYSMLRNDQRKHMLKASDKKIYDFGTGDPQEPTAPFIRHALTDGLTHISQYPASLGKPALRQACAQWAHKRFGVTLDPTRQLIVSNGSKEAIFHTPHLLLNATSPRRTVAFPDPGYPVYRSGTVLAGGEPLPIVLNAQNYALQPHDIPEDQIPNLVALWVNYPHNPTGATIRKEHAQNLYHWARQHNVILLSDECYVDTYEPGSTPPLSFLEVAADDKFLNLVCFFTLSKRSGMTGYRSGFVAGDERLIQIFSKYRPHAGLGTPDFIQSAAIAAWQDTGHVTERNEIFAKKRILVQNFLKTHGFEHLSSTATFFIWAQVPQGFTSGEDYAQHLAETCGIVVTPGDALGGPSCAPWFRMALVPSVEETEECLKLWANQMG